MKKLILFISIFISINTFAQDEVDQTKHICPLTYRVISDNAEKEWPDDYEMQKYFIKKQCSALVEYIQMKYRDIPSEIYSKIHIKALREWSKNDIGQCQNDAKSKKFDEMSACFDADWEMVVYTIKKQCDAYIDLHN